MGVDGADVAAYLGSPGDARITQLAEIHLPVALESVRAYTRGRGFDDGEPNEALETVILSATARAVTNPAGVASQTTGPFAATYFRWDGFTLTELVILNSYRRRSA